MKSLVKTLLALLTIALSLTSDTASSAMPEASGTSLVQRSEPHLSTNSANCVAITPMPKFSEYQSCLRQTQAPILPMHLSE